MEQKPKSRRYQMPTITLSKIDRKIVLDLEDYEWLKANLNVPLPLSGLDYDRNGRLVYATIYKDEDDIMLLFVTCGKNEYALRNVHPRNN